MTPLQEIRNPTAVNRNRHFVQIFGSDRVRTAIVSTMSFLVAMSGLFVLPAMAQDPVRERRRELLDSLLRTLIESQNESRDAHDHDLEFREDRFRDDRFRDQRPNVQGELTSEMVAIRQHVKTMSEECAHLVADLRQLERSTPQVRPLLADAIQINASINVFLQRCNRYRNIAHVRNDFIAIDRDWRILNHRLRQIPTLGNDVCECLDRVHGHHQAMCTVFKLEPQVDRRELARVVTEMHSDLKHLIQDIYYERRNDPATPEIVREGQVLQAQIVQYAPLINQGSYEAMVDAFTQCRDTWRSFSHKAMRIPSQRVRHDVRHLDEHGRQIHELLWLELELDREYVGNVCGWVDHELTQILSEITLADLLNCKNPNAILSSARLFQTQCGTFSKRVSGKQTYEELCVEFRLLETKWDDMNELCRQLNKPTILQRLDEVEFSLASLQSTFGTGPVISHDMLLQITAELGQLVNQAHQQVHLFRPSDFDGSGFAEICRASDQFQNSVRTLHQSVVFGNESIRERQINQCTKHWTQFKSCANQCRENDRRKLAKYRGQIEPLMAKLQLVYFQ